MATPHQLEESLRRQTLVEAASRHPSLTAAAAALGEPIANLSRYRKAYDGTFESLLPKSENAGRPRLAAILTDDEIRFAKQRYLMSESLPLAVEALADSPICSPGSREFLNHYRETRDYPPSLYAALRVSEDEWAQYRNRAQAQKAVFAVRRGMYLLDEEGHRREVVSGDITEEDDVSVDCPYYLTLPDGTFRVGRQVLMARDVRSGAYRGACAVARERDSYRAEDIVRFNRWLIESHGMPGRFRFERGIWASDAVAGIALPDGRRWGGLAQLVPIDPCYSSNGKGGIEASFRLWHKVLGLHGVRIGKSRGEYLVPTRDMMAVNEGRKHPGECGFLAWEKLLAAFEAAGKLINGRAHYDRHSGEDLAPDDIWWRDLQSRPGKRLPACSAEFSHHFLPVKRIVGVGTTHAGHVTVTVDGYRQPYLFRVAGYDAAGKELPYLERKHRVIVCFDPHEAAAGAQIFNLDAGARNRGGFRTLERLFTAPLADDRPQVDLRRERGPADVATQARKVRRQQVRTSFSSIGVFGEGARRVQHSHDGDGRTAQVAGLTGELSPSRGMPDADGRSAIAPPAPRRRPAPVVEVEEWDLTAPAAPAAVAEAEYHLPAQPRRHLAASAVPAVIYEDLDLR